MQGTPVPDLGIIPSFTTAVKCLERPEFASLQHGWMSTLHAFLRNYRFHHKKEVGMPEYQISFTAATWEPQFLMVQCDSMLY
jgi:hypothetical protein